MKAVHEPCWDSDTNKPAVERSFWDKRGNFHMDWVLLSEEIIVNFVSWDDDSEVMKSLFVMSAYQSIFCMKYYIWGFALKYSKNLLGNSQEKKLVKYWSLWIHNISTFVFEIFYNKGF